MFCLVCIPSLLTNFSPAAEVFNAVQVRKRAEQGDAEAQFQLARALSSGIGIKKDVNESILWVRKAAERGLPAAQYSLGFMQENGQLLQRNPAEAVFWYSRAAEQGHPNALSRLDLLANALPSGAGLSKDENQTILWLRKEAESGLPAAQFSLGFMHEYGQFLQRNAAEAVIWYSRAAEQGHTNALRRLEAQGDSVKKLYSVWSSLETGRTNRYEKVRCAIDVSLTETMLMTVRDSTNFTHLMFANSDVRQVRDAFKKFLEWDVIARTKKAEPFNNKLIAELPGTSLYSSKRSISFTYVGGDVEFSTHISFWNFRDGGKGVGLYNRDEVNAFSELLESHQKLRVLCEEKVRKTRSQTDLFK